MKRRPKGTGSVTETAPGVWRVRVYVNRDPVTGHPRQVERTVRGGRRAAEAKMREMERERDAGKYKGTSGTVAHLLSEWLGHLERTGKRPATAEAYRLVAEKHLIPALGDVELRKLDGRILDDYYAGKARAGGSARFKTKALEPNTIRQHHAILSSALTQAVKWGWLPSNPAAQATPPPKRRADRQAPEPEQVRALIDACGDDPDLAMAITLGAITGARRGELCGLQWGDVDWKRGTLRIVRQRQPAVGGDRTVPPKTARPAISLGDAGIAVLRRYRALVEERCADLGVPVVESGWLLSLDGGRTPTRAKGLGEAIAGLSKRAGTPITTHLLRYFAATQMVGAGVDPRTAAGRLGHSPEVLLRVYADFMPRRDLEAAAGLETLVLGPTPAIGVEP